MKKTALFSLLLLTAACGGGGGGSSSTNINTQSTNSTNPTTPVEPVKNILKVKVEYQDYCGNKTTSSDARLIIHNADFTSKEVISPDEDGVMVYEDESDKANVSIAYIGNADDEGYVQLRVKTIVEQPLADIGSIYVKTGDKSQCNCQTTDIRVDSDSDILSGEFRVGNDGRSSYPFEYTDTGILLKGNITCHVNSEGFGDKFVRITAPYYGGSVAAFKNKFQGTEVLTTDYIGEAFNFDVIGNGLSAPVRMYEVRSGERVIQRDFSWYDDDNSPFYYYLIDGVNKAYITAWEGEHLNVDGIESIEFSSHGAKKFEPQGNNDIVLSNLDSNEFVYLISDDSSGYDFTTYDEFDVFHMRVTAKTANNENALWWEITMPLHGTIPEISSIDLESIIADWKIRNDVTLVSSTIYLDGYEGVSGYQDYLQHKATEFSYLDGETRWDNNKYVMLNFDILLEETDILFADTKPPTDLTSKAIEKLQMFKTTKIIPQVTSAIKMKRLFKSKQNR
ncbi:hypothetical protein tinsulaeT_23340 [Thalassotalea insulae]|uniref:Lipoprotein n=1 Tax=Thalassotalea insulae TaxID=2056778 RepID=A0ABQ6GUH9_9GAMM|nr:hypothetical protein [Thalassotalea insulae]GLX78994.1 hypothetical protein tinsulaeT_23340 [Thalassotalea insulae]